MPDFLLPDLGEGLTEAEIITWHVREGDLVTVDQVIAEVETAKALVEVPVPFAGVVTTLHAPAGTTLSVGQPLVTVAADEPAPQLSEPGVVVPERTSPPADGQTSGARRAAGEEASGSVLIGYGTATAPARIRRGHRRRGPAARPAGGPPPRPDSLALTAAPAPAAPAPAAPGLQRRVAVISPLVRKEARDAGLDLASVAGTGPGGVVRRQDLRQALADRAALRNGVRELPPAAPGAPGAGAASGVAAGPAGVAVPAAAGVLAAEAGERRIALRGARRAAADKLSRSRREIPEATVWVDADATGLVEARRALNAADQARPVSILALLARFAIAGLRRYPELGARIEDDEIIISSRVHLGFACQAPSGLVVPVVQDAQQLTTRELSAALAERTAAARERQLAPADLAGGTFTVNNYGVFGVDGSAAIINYPEVAILGMGRIIDRPWVAGGQLAVRKVTELTLAFDHRACDGGTAGGFLRFVADCVESPAAALGDL